MEPSEMHYTTTALYRHSTWNNKQKMRLSLEKNGQKVQNVDGSQMTIQFVF